MSNSQYAKLFLQDNKAEEKDKAQAVSEILSKELNDILHKNNTQEELRRYVRSPHVLNQWIEKRYRELTGKSLAPNAYTVKSIFNYETELPQFFVTIKVKEKSRYRFDIDNIGLGHRHSVEGITVDSIRSGTISAERISNQFYRNVEVEDAEIRGGHGNTRISTMSVHHTAPPNPQGGDTWVTNGHFYQNVLGTWLEQETPSYTEQAIVREVTFRPVPIREQYGVGVVNSNGRAVYRQQPPEEPDSVETVSAEETNSLRTMWNNIWRGWRENQ